MRNDEKLLSCNREGLESKASEGRRSESMNKYLSNSKQRIDPSTNNAHYYYNISEQPNAYEDSHQPEESDPNDPDSSHLLSHPVYPSNFRLQKLKSHSSSN